MTQLNLFQNEDREGIKSQIRRLRRQIIIHSIIYYRFNDNIIPDYQYDGFARKLKQLQAAYPCESREVEFYEDFKDWAYDTCPSGYDLKATAYPRMIDKAKYILDLHYEKEANKQARTGENQ